MKPFEGNLVLYLFVFRLRNRQHVELLYDGLKVLLHEVFYFFYLFWVFVEFVFSLLLRAQNQHFAPFLLKFFHVLLSDFQSLGQIKDMQIRYIDQIKLTTLVLYVVEVGLINSDVVLVI